MKKKEKIPTIYNYRPILYDLLTKSQVILFNNAAKEPYPSTMLFPRNQAINETECIVRMSNLHLNPWIEAYCTPENAIVLSEKFPLIPMDIQYEFALEDNTYIDPQNPRRIYVREEKTKEPAVKRKYLDMAQEIRPIGYKELNITDDESGILNLQKTTEPVFAPLAQNAIPEPLVPLCPPPLKLRFVAANQQTFDLDSTNIATRDNEATNILNDLTQTTIPLDGLDDQEARRIDFHDLLASSVYNPSA